MGITFTFATRQKWHTSCISLSEDSLPSRNDAGGFGWTVTVLVGRENFPTRRTKDSHNRSNLVSYGRELKTITCSRMLSREVKMDVNFTSLPSLQSQSTSQSGTGSVSGGDSAVKTLQNNPDAVVSQTSQSSGPQNDSGSSFSRQEQPELQSAQQALDSLRFSSRKTQVGFNNELNKVFIEVVDTRTDTVVEQIPSEKFVKFVSEQLQPSVERPQDGPNGAVIDKAI